jgi:hypothetical protein
MVQVTSLSSHHEWCSPPRMKMWYNTDDDTGVEVDFVTGALSLLSSLTRVSAGTAHCCL